MAKSDNRKKPNAPAPNPKLVWASSVFFAVFYIAVIFIIVYFSAFAFSKELKNWINDTFSSELATFLTWQLTLNENLRVLLFTIVALIMPLGLWKFYELAYRWFRMKPSFEVPYLTRNFNLPAIPNKLYDEHFLQSGADVKELKGEVKHLQKENATLKKGVDDAQKSKAVLDAEKEHMVQQITNLVQQAEPSFQANLELFRLMGHVLALINVSDFASYQQEFASVMGEFSNSIMKVTVDQGSDKSSSVLMVTDDVLRIVGCNGLRRESREKTFVRGFGFAGWIWEQAMPGICDDVANDSRFDKDPTRHYRSIIGVPIIAYNQRVSGVLLVQSQRSSAFRAERDPVILTYFAKLLAICFSDFERRKAGADGQGGASQSPVSA